MRRKVRNFVALFMAMVICLSMSTSVFAAETEKRVVKTEETIVIPAESTASVNRGPRKIWSNPSYTLNSGTTTYTAQFTIPDRYFAYEISATASDGSSINETYTVQLRSIHGYQVAGQYNTANGSSQKLDWIEVEAGENYLFKIVNSTSRAITVRITYYSWR